MGKNSVNRNVLSNIKVLEFETSLWITLFTKKRDVSPPHSVTVFQKGSTYSCSAKREPKPPECDPKHLAGVFCQEHLLAAENKGGYASKCGMSGGEKKEP